MARGGEGAILAFSRVGAIVGKNGIKAATFYREVDGELVEVANQ